MEKEKEYDPPRATSQERQNVGHENKVLLREIYKELSRNGDVLHKCATKNSLKPVAMLIQGNVGLSDTPLYKHLGVLDKIITSGKDNFRDVLYGGEFKPMEAALFCVLLSDLFNVEFINAKTDITKDWPNSLSQRKVAHVDADGNKRIVFLDRLGGAASVALDKGAPLTKAFAVEARKDPGVNELVNDLVPKGRSGFSKALHEAVSVQVATAKSRRTLGQKIKAAFKDAKGWFGGSKKNKKSADATPSQASPVASSSRQRDPSFTIEPEITAEEQPEKEVPENPPVDEAEDDEAKEFVSVDSDKHPENKQVWKTEDGRKLSVFNGRVTLVPVSGKVLYANVARGVTHLPSALLKAIREQKLRSVASELALLDLGKLPDSGDLNAKEHDHEEENDANLIVARIEKGTPTAGNEIAIGFGGKDQIVLQNNQFPEIIHKLYLAEEAVSMREGKKKRDKEAKAVLDAAETEVVAISVVQAVLGAMMSAEEAKEAIRRINEFAKDF